MIEALSLRPMPFIPRRSMKFTSKHYSQTEGLIVTFTEAMGVKSALINTCQLDRTIRSQFQGPDRKEHSDAMKGLLNSKNIILSKTDKGSGIVVMNNCNYIEKLAAKRSHKTKFTNNPSEKKAERQITVILKELKDAGFITAQAYEQLGSKGSKTPRLCGLPNIKNTETKPTIYGCR